MIDELKQWEYDKGYDKGKADMLKVIEDIKAEINNNQPDADYNHPYHEGYFDAMTEAISIIDKHISGKEN